ncbi:MAG: hypothetical protein H0T50_03115 [Gemmatimonadales bacterium]|nr:hypothetical protein [Gemmatimonadales bacterium]
MVTIGCAEGERLGPTGSEDLPAGPAGQAAASQPGIVFSSSAMTVSQINSVHTGLVEAPTPSGLLNFLSQLRAKGGRVLIKLGGGDGAYRNPDGTFSLTKWKVGVDRFRNINFDSYIADGTIVAHFLVDEPHFGGRWGDQVIPQATLEEAAKHSKLRWPNLPTVVNAPANWLASAPVTYVHLDAGWAMFRSKTSSSPGGYAAQQVKRAKSKGLGLVAGLNVLDGGDGSSGIRGTQPRTWAMSAAELREYGSALLAQSYVCAFSMWRFSDSYYNRADVKSAMAELSAKARSHANTSCRQ